MCWNAVKILLTHSLTHSPMANWLRSWSDFHPANLGFGHTVTCMSHCWHQKGLWAKIAPLCQKSPSFMWSHPSLDYEECMMVNRPHFTELLYEISVMSYLEQMIFDFELNSGLNYPHTFEIHTRLAVLSYDIWVTFIRCLGTELLYFILQHPKKQTILRGKCKVSCFNMDSCAYVHRLGCWRQRANETLGNPTLSQGNPEHLVVRDKDGRLQVSKCMECDTFCLQCCDTVDWTTGRTSSL